MPFVNGCARAQVAGETKRISIYFGAAVFSTDSFQRDAAKWIAMPVAHGIGQPRPSKIESPAFTSHAHVREPIWREGKTRKAALQ